MVNSDTAFIGSIPEYYDRYFGPIIFEEYAQDLVRRVNTLSGGIVLEIAAGTGIVTRRLRNALPQDVKVIATDLNESMLDFAKGKFNGNENIRFEAADADNLSYPPAFFDAVVSQFSLMFFPDKQVAINEVARVLKPGGEFIFNIWDSFEHNHLLQTVNEALIQLFEDDPPKFFDVPYCYYQIDEVKRLLGRTGFGDIEISVLPRISRSETARHVALATILGTPASLQIVERGVELEHVIDIVEDAVSETYGHSSIETKMQAIVFKACLPI